MHSLVRFIGDETRLEVLARLREALDEVVPETFTRYDKVPGRFSRSLCSSDDPEAHRTSILDFVHKCAEILTQAKTLDVAVVFDIIVHPEDRAGSIYTSIFIDKDLMQTLVSFGGEIELSVCDYAPE